MDKVNSQLYQQNCYIIRQNEMLRKKAKQLNQENQALLSELKQKLSKANSNHNSNPDINLSSASTTDPMNLNKT
ncbi:hypothetical protein JCGZ_10420 [Jatropha curcas]|uniref:Protein LITTLE ZIPPER 4 n=1 Tax=Jatropha curcas TaxID=180498 RepID=A0A067KVC3_JATCU|nr:protein LITTLE ZIPPER 3 [Jatropha curcas]KDP35784.1 hypothetical protein JCGZ_10420 [Jatropha curcas]